MNKKLLISLFILALTVVYAGVIIPPNGLSVKSQDGNVVITWQTTTETNLKHFVIERKSINGSFVEIAIVQPQADKNYRYVDQTAYKTSDAFYVYRIKIVCYNEVDHYSAAMSVDHNVSSAKRTWGSIKALFR